MLAFSRLLFISLITALCSCGATQVAPKEYVSVTNVNTREKQTIYSEGAVNKFQDAFLNGTVVLVKRSPAFRYEIDLNGEAIWLLSDAGIGVHKSEPNKYFRVDTKSIVEFLR